MRMRDLWYWPEGGWDFDRWRLSHAWTPVRSDQSGNPRLSPLLTRQATLGDWLVRREEIHRGGQELIGTIPDPPIPLHWESTEPQTEEGITRSLLRYSLTDREDGYAWLLRPQDHAHPLPAMVALHQTVPQGKDEPAGVEGDPELAYARELAGRGYSVLAPDAIGFGERRRDRPGSHFHSAEEFFDRYPDGSVMAKMAWDTRRAVDLLRSLPGVDRGRIGCIGHSHGGYGTLFALLADDRLRAGVISCGMTPFRSDPTPERWWRKTALLPRLGYYEHRIEETPLDFHHLLALAPPGPF